MVIDNGIVLWTHVTSPFVEEYLYTDMINYYLKNLKYHDSLMSVTKIQKFLWNDNNPISYDRKEEKWPKTQNIKAIYEINKGD